MICSKPTREIKKRSKRSSLDTLLRLSANSEGKPVLPEKYLTEEEKKHVVPSGKRIVRDETWDRKFEHYWAGVEPPTPEQIDEKPDQVYYWYDLALDVTRRYNPERKEWEQTTELEKVPKLAFETKTWRHVGYVEDDPPATKTALSDLLDAKEEF